MRSLSFTVTVESAVDKIVSFYHLRPFNPPHFNTGIYSRVGSKVKIPTLKGINKDVECDRTTYVSNLRIQLFFFIACASQILREVNDTFTSKSRKGDL